MNAAYLSVWSQGLFREMRNCSRKYAYTLLALFDVNKDEMMKVSGKKSNRLPKWLESSVQIDILEEKGTSNRSAFPPKFDEILTLLVPWKRWTYLAICRRIIVWIRAKNLKREWDQWLENAWKSSKKVEGKGWVCSLYVYEKQLENWQPKEHMK